MKRNIVVILLALLSLSLFVYASEQNNKVVAKVGTEKITYGMLKKAYNKNLTKGQKAFKDLNKSDFLSFLKRYTDYRLKVLDAIDKGYDKDESVIADIDKNKTLLAESFYFESRLLNPKLEDMYKKRKVEYKFSYIIIPKMKDTVMNLTPLEKANEVLKKLKAGEKFEALAEVYSADENTAKTGGLVDKYLTAGKIQKPIEEVLYTLKPGEYYPKYIETKYGIFIVKLENREKREYVNASHILIAFDAEKEKEMEAKADEALEALKNGEKFEDVAKEYSDDDMTASMGGLLEGFYSRSTGYDATGRPLEKKFEEALFKLKDGEYSGKVKTEYGIHIIKRNKSKQVEHDEEIEKLKSIYKKTFYEEDKAKFLDSLARDYGYSLYVKGMNAFHSQIDTLLRNLGPQWADSVDEKTKKELLFIFDGKEWTVGEFIDLAKTLIELRGINLNTRGLYKATHTIVKPLLIKKATANLENENKEFAELVSEFRDGIMLFKVEDEEVWQKRTFDTTLAKVYFDSTKTRYKTNVMYDLAEIFILAQKEANEVYKEIQSGVKFDKIVGLKTQRPNYREKNGQFGWVDSQNHFLGKYIENDKAEKGKVYPPVATSGGFSIFKINDIRPIRQKTFDEAIPDISPMVQDIVQDKIRKKWLERVSKKHEIVINDSVINNIVSN